VSDNNPTVPSLRTANASPWLADPSNTAMWLQYFQSLTPDNANQNSNGRNAPSFQWFGLNSNGRSFGSGQEEIPQWLQVLGQHLRPTGAFVLTESDDPSPTLDPDLLQCVTFFYDALTTGDAKGIQTIFSAKKSLQVSEVRLLTFCFWRVPTSDAISFLHLFVFLLWIALDVVLGTV
jgi:hypothetical protein